MTEQAVAVEQIVRKALEAIKPGGGGADITRELGLDSVQVMDMIMEVEDHLDISVPAETLADARTLDQLCAGIARLL